jgi:polysaccharide deacetylase family protein (PEP-CTERM system associated)
VTQPLPPLLLSFDVEDWHQLVHRAHGLESWERPGPAFERQMQAIVELLGELRFSATFFVLGATASAYPDVIRELAARGYELASHGQAHERVYRQTPDDFRRDLETSAETIEALTGRRPRGYRAPAFSVNRDTPWAFEILAELGFRYDSSQYDSPRVPRRITGVPKVPYELRLPSGRSLWEFPITVWQLGGRALPLGGAGYWRFLPVTVVSRMLERAGADGAYPVLYLHPYEFDPRPLRADVLPPAASTRGVSARLRTLQRNIERRRAATVLRRLAGQVTAHSHAEAYAAVTEQHGASSRALSPEGVLL